MGSIDLSALTAVPEGVRSTLGLPFSVKVYGAAGDGVRVADAAITSGTDDLTSATAAFTSADVGKTIIVDGAGASGVALTTTISAYVSATAVTLAANASTTVSGAVATFGTDDTAAIAATVAAATDSQTAPSAAVVFPASDGWYIYNGNGIDADQRLAILGVDRAVSRVVLGAGKRLVKTTGYCDRFTMTGLTVWGGKGAYEGTFTSANNTGSKVIEQCDFRAYTECAISTDSSDSPYWRIRSNLFAPANSTGTIGIAMGIDASGTVIRGNVFQGGRICVKLRGGGLSVVVDGNDFVGFDAGDAGSPRAKVWIVPHTSGTNGGNGCRIINNKFGNENIQAHDLNILYADEGSGSTNATKMPATTDSTGYVYGHSYTGNRFSGGGTALPDIFTRTPNVKVHIGANEHDGTAPTYLLEFDSSVTVSADPTVAKLTVDTQVRNGLTIANKTISTDGSAVVDSEVWLSSADLHGVLGSPNRAAVTGALAPSWMLDASTDEGVAGTQLVPSSWVTFHVDMIWTNEGAGSGDVRFASVYDAWSDGSTLNGGAPSFSDQTITAPAQRVIKTTRCITSLPNTDRWLSIALYRDADHAADTLANDIAIIGFKLTRAT